MDTAVALVQAYLNANGYFTVVEYPVVEALRNQPARSVTDLDVLAFRFAGAGHEIIRGSHAGPLGARAFEPDPVLGWRADRPDMIVGEVKEGPARFNATARDPRVLEVALARFGCCRPEEAADLTRRLLARGQVDTPAGHTIRMVAFGAAPEGGEQARWKTLSMGHVVDFLKNHLRDHWDVWRHIQTKDTTLGLLALLEKYAERSPRQTSALDGEANAK